MSRNNTPQNGKTPAQPTPTDEPRHSLRIDTKTLEVQAVLDAFAGIVAGMAVDLIAARDDQASVSPYMSVEEAAAYMRCKPKRIYDLCSARRLTRYRDGSRVLLHRDELDAYLAADALPARCPMPGNTASAQVSRAA